MIRYATAYASSLTAWGAELAGAVGEADLAVVVAARLAVLGLDDLVGIRARRHLAHEVGDVVVEIELVAIDRAVGIDREAAESDDRRSPDRRSAW